MPRCLDCGHTGSFIHRLVETEVVYYSESGEAIDSKSLEVEESTIITCYECRSRDVEE